MQNSNGVSDSPSKSDFSLVYYYLLAGISLLAAVFFFLPRVTLG
ncbi:MAG TPA: hypothetical protein PK831_03635 [Candidatus Magasanikbacteria bacterium]|jgi:hypothetical protein|nr:hypothetical protein [Candidatus Magasanikbacteria bacterium]HQL53014.1 hypothetical protein [Candidatus Magasanikbacteria bacterium]